MLISQNMRAQRRFRTVVAYIVLTLFLIFALGPLIWLASTSVKPLADVYSWPPSLFTDNPQWANYLSIFQRRSMGAYITNGLIAATVATFGSLVLGTLHAYAVSRFKFRGSTMSMFLVILVRFFPPIALSIPFYVLYRTFGIIDTKVGIILIFMFLFEPFVVWILKGFFDTIPRELEDAAYLDGCSRLQTLRFVLLPLIRNGLVASATFAWLFSWNEFVLVLALTNTDRAQTVPIGLVTFITDHWVEWPEMTAAATVASVPALLVILFFSEYLVKGLMGGAVKG